MLKKDNLRIAILNFIPLKKGLLMKYLIKIILTFSMLASTINAFGQHTQWVELTMYPGTEQEMYGWLKDLQQESKAANSQCYYLVAQAMTGEPRI
jgi:hypothetical protein